MASGTTDAMTEADPYAVGLSDGTRMEREALVADLRHEAGEKSPIVKALLLQLADKYARGEHRG